MNRLQHHQNTVDLEILRRENGAIDYAAYDVRARQERSMAFHAAVAASVEFIRSNLTGIARQLTGIAKAALRGARHCDPARLEIGRKCPSPLGS